MSCTIRPSLLPAPTLEPRRRVPSLVALLLLLPLTLAVGCGGGGSRGGGGAADQTLRRQVLPGQGLEVMTVDFLFEEAVIAAPPWWRIEVQPTRLAEMTGIPAGYLNVVTARGWAVQNLPVPTPGAPTYAVYCDLGLDISPDLEMAGVDLQVMHSSTPVLDIRARLEEMEDPRTFQLGRWAWNAQGAGDRVTLFTGAPDRIAPLDAAVPRGSETFAFHQAVTYQQTAHNQCITMALADALQYLENRGVVTVPHDHDLGLKGDSTLVGRLDTATDRPVVSRSDGTGVWFTPMVDGFFEYLQDAKRAGILTFRHQGRGYGTAPNQALPAGNRTSGGSTSQDDGAAMTFDWVLDRLRAGCGVVAVMEYDSGGGHAVRITAAGRLNGRAWVWYAHDAYQTNIDAKDQKGLEAIHIWLEDSDQDGRLNFGTSTRELAFLFAQCP